MTEHSTANQLQRLEYAAQSAGSAIAEICGHKVACRIRKQTRNGRHISSAYYEMDGKRAKYTEVLRAIGATA